MIRASLRKALAERLRAMMLAPLGPGLLVVACLSLRRDSFAELAYDFVKVCPEALVVPLLAAIAVSASLRALVGAGLACPVQSPC
jgi:hypothetical protein